MNYSLIKVEYKILQQFESYSFVSSFTQGISIYAENYDNNDSIFDDYFAMGKNNENVG